MRSLEVKALTKAFGGLTALQDVSFAVRSGTVHSVIGPNGAGKTTLLNLVTGMYARADLGAGVVRSTEDITGLAARTSVCRRSASRAPSRTCRCA